MTRTIHTTWRKSQRSIAHPGDELSIKHIPGRVLFRQHVVLADGREWIDVIHPTLGFFSVRPERVRLIHRTHKTRPASQRLIGATS